MTQDQIIQALHRLEEELSKEGLRGEIGIVGGAAMVLAFNARKATKDVDAIFEPSSQIREAAARIAPRLGLPNDWINDAVKGFMPANSSPRQVILDLPHLTVWIPPTPYLLAMKAISARFDTHDAQDLKTRIRFFKIKSPEQVFELIENYYPRKAIPAKTQFFLEELFDELG